MPQDHLNSKNLHNTRKDIKQKLQNIKFRSCGVIIQSEIVLNRTFDGDSD